MKVKALIWPIDNIQFFNPSGKIFHFFTTTLENFTPFLSQNTPKRRYYVLLVKLGIHFKYQTRLRLEIHIGNTG